MNLEAIEANLMYRYTQEANHVANQRWIVKSILDKLESTLDKWEDLEVTQASSGNEEKKVKLPVKAFLQTHKILNDLKGEHEISFSDSELEYLFDLFTNSGTWESGHLFVTTVCAIERKIKDARA